ncbi:MAG: hypothetical protein CL583_03450 [Alteromonadaceae bacterium]|nr:hypothetical protein [Alteromonadaceae bacterium]|tara:strand:- start:1035 stop:2132 length:1098 start_codon:yes stop_codon:yes gene_type:complete
MRQDIPPSNDLNIGALAGLFHNTTNSYKLLFFQALLGIVESRSAVNDSNCRIDLKLLCSNVLRFGWYPHKFFKLSFGSQDKIGRALDKLRFGINESAITNPSTKARLNEAIHEQFTEIGADFLTRYVPYRLLTSFFTAELKGLLDTQKNRAIAHLAEQSFQTVSPALYRFTNGQSEIELNPQWNTYIRANLAIIKGWALFQWAGYLQRKNPNIPALIRKIEPPIKRASLSEQTRFWNTVVLDQPIHCIYSGAFLQPSSFALDHFLPWSFVCHDELWNLIPVDPRANSSKGGSLPNDKFIDPFIEQQVNALRVHRERTDKSWKKTVQPYVEGLSLTEEEVATPETVGHALSNKIKPLISLARTMGY